MTFFSQDVSYVYVFNKRCVYLGLFTNINNCFKACKYCRGNIEVAKWEDILL